MEDLSNAGFLKGALTQEKSINNSIESIDEPMTFLKKENLEPIPKDVVTELKTEKISNNPENSLPQSVIDDVKSQDNQIFKLQNVPEIYDSQKFFRDIMTMLKANAPIIVPLSIIAFIAIIAQLSKN